MMISMQMIPMHSHTREKKKKTNSRKQPTNKSNEYHKEKGMGLKYWTKSLLATVVMDAFRICRDLKGKKIVFFVHFSAKPAPLELIFASN
jgi:hypothetical protein